MARNPLLSVVSVLCLVRGGPVKPLQIFVAGHESRVHLLESNPSGNTVVAIIFVGKVFFPMAKRRGNPNWGKPEPIGPVTPTITEFEQVVREYKLSPDQYLRSTRLREWARRNKNSKYIPEPLLEAWGFEIESTL